MYIENKSHGETQLYAFLPLNSFKEKQARLKPTAQSSDNLKQFEKPRAMNSSRAGYEIFTQVQGQTGILLFMGHVGYGPNHQWPTFWD